MQQLHHKLVNKKNILKFCRFMWAVAALGMVAEWLGDVGEWGEK